MRMETFIEKRQTDWQRLETLVNRAKSSAETLSAADLYELGTLYRSATSDLALAQRDFPNGQVTTYLNQLVARGHGLIYREEPLRRQQVSDFFAVTFPQLFRRLLPYTMVSFLIFFVPALVAFAMVAADTERVYIFLGADANTEALVRTVESGELWTDIAPSVRSAASAAILTNNIGVMFMAFAGSATAGLFTLFILLINGLSIGGVFGLLQAHGMSGGLAEFVVAHGFIELSVIFLAGGCGLYVGEAIIRPGLLSRKDALVQRARVAVSVVLGCVPLLVLAGIIEGFISPSGLPWIVKTAVGVGTGVALYWYWLRPPSSR
ncbi:MAG: stage II sporulation protein M [Caldilineaceae bacterium]|nr:stage II sporulation protein M [Caldilineaceae bacterium]